MLVGGHRLVGEKYGVVRGGKIGVCNRSARGHSLEYL